MGELTDLLFTILGKTGRWFNVQQMRIKVPVEFPLQLQYEKIAFFPPTSEKIIHFQIIKNNEIIEYFAKEDHFPRYKWIERTENSYSQVGSFVVKNPLGKPIDNKKER